MVTLLRTAGVNLMRQPGKVSVFREARVALANEILGILGELRLKVSANDWNEIVREIDEARREIEKSMPQSEKDNHKHT